MLFQQLPDLLCIPNRRIHSFIVLFASSLAHKYPTRETSDLADNYVLPSLQELFKTLLPPSAATRVEEGWEHTVGEELEGYVLPAVQEVCKAFPVKLPATVKILSGKSCCASPYPDGRTNIDEGLVLSG